MPLASRAFLEVASLVRRGPMTSAAVAHRANVMANAQNAPSKAPAECTSAVFTMLRKKARK